MSVQRIHTGHQTRYEVRNGSGLHCALTYTAEPGEPAVWKVLLPGPDGTEDLYGTHEFGDPDAAQLRAWLGSHLDDGDAAELTAAVDAAPPASAAWRRADAG
ncbi:MAG TPA: hypothetical protein VIZ43_15595 [Trebonia sp.]